MGKTSNSPRENSSELDSRWESIAVFRRLCDSLKIANRLTNSPLSQFEEGLEMWSTLLSKNHESSTRVAPESGILRPHRQRQAVSSSSAQVRSSLNDNFE